MTVMIWFTVLVVMQGCVVMFLVWMLRKRQVWGLIKFAIKGGSLVLKGYPNNTVEIMQTSKPIDHINWKARDPTTGKRTELKQMVTRVHHTLKGTSYPIHFCPSTYPTNINMLTKEKAELSTKEINALMAKQYTQGAADATAFKTIGGFPIDKATLMALLAIGVINIITLVFAWQTLSLMNPTG